MLTKAFFIVDTDGRDQSPDIQLPPDAIVAYRITGKIAGEIESLHSNLYLTGVDFPFCLYIELNEALCGATGIFDKRMDYVLSIVFHYRYLTSGNKTPFLLIKPASDAYEKFIPVIKEKLQAQGYDDIEYILIGEKNLRRPEETIKLNHLASTSPEELQTGYLSFLKNSQVTLPPILVHVGQPEDVLPLIKVLERTEEEFAQSWPQLFALLDYNKKLSEKNRALLFEIGLLQEKLESKASYDQFFNQQDSQYRKQVIEIVEFYKYEYEILPMWFKRMGHVIKVLAGKRSFKSLFNDNVKKYKV